MSDPVQPRRPWYDRPLRLGTVSGVPVALSTSWLLITVVMIVLFAPRIRSWLPSVSWPAAAGVALLYTVILAVSVLLHELAHAVAARSVGWTGSSIEITLWGGHTTFREIDSTPGRSLLVSLVGPAVNLLLGGLCWGLQEGLEPGDLTGLLLGMATWSNLAVGVFNLLPGLPLDGGRLVESAAWRITGSRAKGTIAAGWAGRILVVVGVAAAVGSWVAQRSAPSLLPLIVVVAVLLPLWTGAGAAIEHGRLRLRVASLSAGRLMVPVVMLPETASVADAVAQGVRGRVVVLAREPGTGHLLRILPEAVEAVPEPAMAGTPVARAGVVAEDAGLVTTAADGDDLVAAVATSVSGTVLVMDGADRCVGAILKEDVIAVLTGHDEKENIH